MNSLVREEYLSQEVFTAPPQKLQLMLVDAAIRFGERAKKYWELGQHDAAFDALIRCQNIMAELLRGLMPSRETELAQRLAGVYVFIYRGFIEAARSRDAASLADALRVLEIERETWRQVCEKLGATITKAPHFDMTRVSSFSAEG